MAPGKKFVSGSSSKGGAGRRNNGNMRSRINNRIGSRQRQEIDRLLSQNSISPHFARSAWFSLALEDLCLSLQSIERDLLEVRRNLLSMEKAIKNMGNKSRKGKN